MVVHELDASTGMWVIVRELKSSNLEDILSIQTLYQMGSLDARLIPNFIWHKHGKEEVEYEHQLLEPILKGMYDIMHHGVPGTDHADCAGPGGVLVMVGGQMGFPGGWS